MKKTLILFAAFLTLLLGSCGTKSGKFRLEGRLRHMNQAELWVYSPTNAFAGFDTIRVRDGRFSYEIDLEEDATLVIVFPNYSEQPVFAEPGEKVSIKGDASHMKEMIIQGTTDNEDMTSLRMELNDLTPPDIPEAVSTFIKENRKSQASIYLLQRYFLLTPDPDYRQARILTEMLLEERPNDEQLTRLRNQLRKLENCAVKARMPKFSATDVKGRRVTEQSLKSKVNVVTTWASWSYASTNLLQRLEKLKETYGDELGLLTIGVDGAPNECRQRVKRDSITWPMVCDGRMWASPLLGTFGMADVPSNVVIDKKGVVIARNLTEQALEERIKKILK